MGLLSIRDFSDTLGEIYEVVAGEARVALCLESAVPLPQSPVREGDSFRLELTGPHDPLLPQATYPMLNRDRTFEIFIVPIARTQTETRYEAVFN